MLTALSYPWAVHAATIAASAPELRVPLVLAGGWRQTLLALAPAPPLRPGSVAIEFEMEPGVAVRGHWHGGNRHDGHRPAAVLLLHGLSGDASSSYVVDAANAFGARGFGVLRLEARGAGGTLGISRSTYHAAQSGDPVRVAAQLAQRFGLERVHLVGFSLGGSVALRALVRDSVPPCVASAVAVSPPLDLAAASARLERGPLERLAARVFLRHLAGLVAERLRMDPSARERCRAEPAALARLRTVRELDDLFTAPLAGYASAEDYYRDASPDLPAGPLPVPALVLQAEDDPLVDAGHARALARLDRGDLGVHLVRHGGHLGFVDRLWPGPGPSWLSLCLVRWIEALETTTAPLPGTAG